MNEAVTVKEMLEVPNVSRFAVSQQLRIERAAKRSESITYQVEEWADIRAEMETLFPRHWEEVAVDQDKIKLAPNYERYDALTSAGVVHIVTVRADGRIVGYHVCILGPHPHYQNDLHALTDVFYLLPEYRRGRTGIRMFQFSEKTLKAKGVKKMMASVKLHIDVGNVFRYLGWTEIERTYSKYIGD